MVDLDKIGEMINKVMNENCMTTMAKMPDCSVNMVLTSPPYWSLRDYSGAEMVWGGDKDCEHNWGDRILPLNSKSGKHSEKSIVGIKLGQGQDNVRRGKGSQFCSKCGAWKGQLGLESTFDLYIKHLCDIFDEVKRILRDDGTCWINIGDTYNAGGNYRGKELGDGSKEVYRRKDFEGCQFDKNNQGVGVKSLIMIPFRFAIEMVANKIQCRSCNHIQKETWWGKRIDKAGRILKSCPNCGKSFYKLYENGWILRNTIIWYKKSAMPSSVRDRFTVDFEYLFFFSKKKKYYFEQQFDNYADSSIPRMEYPRYAKNSKGMSGKYAVNSPEYKKFIGRNKRTVWTINPKPFSEAHFATFPLELVETPIKAGCPEFVCKKCGNPREKIIETENRPNKLKTNADVKTNNDKTGKINRSNFPGDLRENKFIGYTDCGCGAKFTGGIVYDPFFGAGTTGLVAHRLNRKFIGSEISKEYCKIAEKRLAPEIKQVRVF